jgi:hypothetical protein
MDEDLRWIARNTHPAGRQHPRSVAGKPSFQCGRARAALPLRVLLTIAMLLALPVGALSNSARLAIIVEDPRLAAGADLLTAELSKRSDIELLERDQILKIRREAALTVARGNEYLKLGNLLGADGVLVLDVREQAGRFLVSVRLAAVTPGVLLDVAEYELSAETRNEPGGREGPRTVAEPGRNARNVAEISLADSGPRQISKPPGQGQTLLSSLTC